MRELEVEVTAALLVLWRFCSRARREKLYRVVRELYGVPILDGVYLLMRLYWLHVRVRCVVPKPAGLAGRLCGLKERSCLRTEMTDTGVVGHTGERERARMRCALRV